MEQSKIVDKIEAINIEEKHEKDAKDNEQNEPIHFKSEGKLYFPIEENHDRISEVMGTEILNRIHPRLMGIKPQLKELIFKQNKIYLNISAEKFKYTDSNIYHVQNLMERIKFYREKLIRIRRTMIDIHKKSKTLKNRAANLRKQAENLSVKK